MEQLIYTYQTICNSNGKSYIGVHKTKNINDGYMGNGILYNRPSSVKKANAFHNAVKKYGFDDFTKHIMCFFDTYEEAMEEEKFLVDSNWVKRNDNYNTAIGGHGNSKEGLTEEQRNKFKEKISGTGNHRYGKKSNNAKAVLKYSLSNVFINEYESLAEAANSINMTTSAISLCCRGKIKQTKGFVFRFKNYSNDGLNKLNKNLSKFKIKYNIDGSAYYKENGIKMESTRGKGWKHSEETKMKMRLSKIKNDMRNERQ
jgi:hypothetical protein